MASRGTRRGSRKAKAQPEQEEEVAQVTQYNEQESDNDSHDTIMEEHSSEEETSEEEEEEEVTPKKSKKKATVANKHRSLAPSPAETKKIKRRRGVVHIPASTQVIVPGKKGAKGTKVNLSEMSKREKVMKTLKKLRDTGVVPNAKIIGIFSEYQELLGNGETGFNFHRVIKKDPFKAGGPCTYAITLIIPISMKGGTVEECIELECTLPKAAYAHDKDSQINLKYRTCCEDPELKKGVVFIDAISEWTRDDVVTYYASECRVEWEQSVDFEQ